MLARQDRRPSRYLGRGCREIALLMQLPRKQPEVNELVFFPLGTGEYGCGIIVKVEISHVTVSFGDCEKRIDRMNTCIGTNSKSVSPEAGYLVGKTFPNANAVVTELRKYLLRK